MVIGTFEGVDLAACVDDNASCCLDLRLREVEDKTASPAAVDDPVLTGGELLEHSLETYITQLGRTPLLDADEEQLLGRCIEQGKYLSRLRRKLRADCRRWPTASEMLLAMAGQLASSGALYGALCRELGATSRESIGQALLNPGLRAAIDGYIDSKLVEAVSNELGSSPERTTRALMEFSLASGLIPWHLLAELVEPGGLEQLRVWVDSPEVRHRLERSEAELSRHFGRVHDDAQRAFDRLVCSNVRLVIAWTKRYASADIPFIDLIQEGIVGLIRAATRFDHHRGHRFSTYATWWIRQALGQAVAGQWRPFRLPRSTVGKIGALHRVEERFSQEHGRLPHRDELAHEMGITPHRVDELRRAVSPSVISLQSVLGDGEEETEVADVVEDKRTPSPLDEASESLLRQQVFAVLQSLAPRERRVVQLRFGFAGGRSHTLAEIGAELGVSKQRVRQIEAKALATLREHSEVGALRDYLT